MGTLEGYVIEVNCPFSTESVRLGDPLRNGSVAFAVNFTRLQDGDMALPGLVNKYVKSPAV